MTNTRVTAALVGVLFLVATATFMLAEQLITGVLGRPDFLGAGSDADALTAGALFAFVDGLAVVGIAVVLYPLLRHQSEALALGYVGLRVAELGVILLYLSAPLLVIAIGGGLRAGTIDATASQSLAPLLRALHDVSIVLVYLFTGVAGGILSVALYRSRLVPRALAALGLIGYPVLLAGSVLDMFGVVDVTQGAGMLAVLPGGLFELILPIWLIARGFRSPLSTDVAAIVTRSRLESAAPSAQEPTPVAS
jgi:hypothetical protein